MVMTVALDGCRTDGYRGLVTVAMMTVPLCLRVTQRHGGGDHMRILYRPSEMEMIIK